MTEEVLRKHFEKYGEVTEVNLLRKSDGKLVGCGFIQFVKKNSAAKAILSCSGKPLMGETLLYFLLIFFLCFLFCVYC